MRCFRSDQSYHKRPCKGLLWHVAVTLVTNSTVNCKGYGVGRGFSAPVGRSLFIITEDPPAVSALRNTSNSKWTAQSQRSKNDRRFLYFSMVGLRSRCAASFGICSKGALRFAIQVALRWLLFSLYKYRRTCCRLLPADTTHRKIQTDTSELCAGDVPNPTRECREWLVHSDFF